MKPDLTLFRKVFDCDLGWETTNQDRIQIKVPRYRGTGYGSLGQRITYDERWQHIIEWHPELEGFEADVLETIRKGRRRQDPIDAEVQIYLSVARLPFGLTIRRGCQA